MILVYVEIEAGAVAEVSLEAVTFARDLSTAGNGVPIDAVVTGPVPEGTAAELASIRAWLEDQDANPDWPAHVRAVLEDLQQRLAPEGDRGL